MGKTYFIPQLENSKILDAFEMVEKEDMIKDKMKDALQVVLKDTAQKILFDSLMGVESIGEVPNAPRPKTQFDQAMEEWMP